MKKKLITFIILLIIFLRPIVYIATHSSVFFEPSYGSRYEAVKALYFSSQYMIKGNPAIIPDEVLESYAGGAFLRGLNPILIVHDQPPLGRYFLSLSILIFNNENTIMLIFLGASALGIYLLSRLIISNYYLSFVPLLIFLNEPLMFIKLKHTPLLEPIQLPFIIFSLYFFILFMQHKQNRYAIFSAVCLGAVISTRFFVLGGVLLSSQLLFFLYKKNLRLLIRYIAFLPLSLVVLFASYTRSIQDSESLLAPLGIQRYMLEYHSSKFVQLFTVWDLLLFNRWHTWWGTKAISYDPNWSVLWPLATVLTGLVIVLGLIKKIKIKDSEIILSLWVVFYLLMLSSGFTSTRYFLPLLPFLYILAMSLLSRVSLKHIMKKL